MIQTLSTGMIALCWIAEGRSKLNFPSTLVRLIDEKTSLPICVDASEELGFEFHIIKAAISHMINHNTS
jgi:hypothetical protein